MISSSMAAYAFARIQFRLKKFWFTLVLATMMLPGAVTMIPGLYDVELPGRSGYLCAADPAGLFGGGAFNIFLLRQFIMGIPNTLDEAARIEGAGFLDLREDYPPID